MAYEYAVITNVGRQMLNDALTQKLILDHASGGAGNVNPVLLMGQTAVSDERQTFPIIGVTEADQAGGKGKKISIQVTNTDLSSSYNLRQLGIFAKLEKDDEPKLLAILQDITGYHIPSSDEMKDFAITFYTVIAIGNEIKLEITMDPSALITRASMEDFLNEHNLSDSAHPHIISPVFEEAEKRENIASGEKLSTLFGKIKKWLSDLKSVAFTGKYSDLTGTPSIPAASDANPKGPGAASPGSGTTWARGDHVHPAQTDVTGSSGSCTGNAASATKLKDPRSIFGQTFDGSQNVAGPGTFYGHYNPDPNGRYGAGAITIREVDNVGASQTDLGYAPFIAFHWGGRTGGTIAYDGTFHFLDISGSRAAPINGWFSHPLKFASGAFYNGFSEVSVSAEDVVGFTPVRKWELYDTISIQDTILSGFVTNNQYAYFTIPLGKPVEDGVYTVITLKGELYGINGVIASDYFSTLKNISARLDHASGILCITLYFTQEEGDPAVVNNTPVCFLARMFSIIFSTSPYGDEPMPGPEIFADRAGEEGPSVEDSVQTAEKMSGNNEQASTEQTEHTGPDAVTDDAGEAVPETEETEGEI